MLAERLTGARAAATNTSSANHSRLMRSVDGPAYTSSITGPALRVWSQGESGLWCGQSECDSSKWYAGCAAETDCETSSEWSPKAAASASQHGNNAVLSQNTTQASTKATRANPCGLRGRLASDTPVNLRIDESAFIKLHRCQESLTTMRTTIFTRRQTGVCSLPYID